MNILITNIWLSNYAGTEVYVRDLAVALHRRGIHVEVYSPQLGNVAEDIRKAGIHIVDDASALVRTPDLIHAQHFGPAMDVMLRFPETPAVYFLHDRTYHGDTPPRFSQIMHHVAVDYNCLERLLIDNGIEEQETSVLYNWVDTSRFALRSSFAERPRRALVFSNYARPDNYFQVVQEACQRAGIELDGAGAGLGNQVQQPEQILGDYDIVFAKAKAAMEAMATGAFVIACDYRGLGGAVTAEHFDYFRKYNFGMKTLAKPHDADLIVEEMQKYDAATAKAVAHRIREEASFDTYLDKILPLYHRMIKKHREEGFRDTGSDKSTLKDYLTWKQQQLQQRIEKKDKQLQAKNQQLAATEQQLTQKVKQLAAQEQQLAEKDKQLAERDQRLSAKDQELAMKNKLLDENNHQLTESNQQLSITNQQLALKDQEQAENKKLLAATEQQLSVTNQQLINSNQEIRRQVARNHDLTTSLSYRLGRLITWPLRWIYDRVKKS